VNMPIPTNPQQIQVLNVMAQFYRCFIKKFVFIMALITLVEIGQNVTTLFATTCNY